MNTVWPSECSTLRLSPIFCWSFSRSQILNIKDLRHSDTGNYTCELFNAFGTLNATYALLVTGNSHPDWTFALSSFRKTRILRRWSSEHEHWNGQKCHTELSCAHRWSDDENSSQSFLRLPSSIFFTSHSSGWRDSICNTSFDRRRSSSTRNNTNFSPERRKTRYTSSRTFSPHRCFSSERRRQTRETTSVWFRMPNSPTIAKPPWRSSTAAKGILISSSTPLSFPCSSSACCCVWSFVFDIDIDETRVKGVARRCAKLLFEHASRWFPRPAVALVKITWRIVSIPFLSLAAILPSATVSLPISAPWPVRTCTILVSKPCRFLSEQLLKVYSEKSGNKYLRERKKTTLIRVRWECPDCHWVEWPMVLHRWLNRSLRETSDPAGVHRCLVLHLLSSGSPSLRTSNTIDAACRDWSRERSQWWTSNRRRGDVESDQCVAVLSNRNWSARWRRRRESKGSEEDRWRRWWAIDVDNDEDVTNRVICESCVDTNGRTWWTASLGRRSLDARRRYSWSCRWCWSIWRHTGCTSRRCVQDWRKWSFGWYNNGREWYSCSSWRCSCWCSSTNRRPASVDHDRWSNTIDKSRNRHPGSRSCRWTPWAAGRFEKEPVRDSSGCVFSPRWTSPKWNRWIAASCENPFSFGIDVSPTRKPSVPVDVSSLPCVEGCFERSDPAHLWRNNWPLRPGIDAIEHVSSRDEEDKWRRSSKP